MITHSTIKSKELLIKIMIFYELFGIKMYCTIKYSKYLFLHNYSKQNRKAITYNFLENNLLKQAVKGRGVTTKVDWDPQTMFYLYFPIRGHSSNIERYEQRVSAQTKRYGMVRKRRGIAEKYVQQEVQILNNFHNYKEKENKV